ncbi:MAG: hypothetical protein ACR2QL_03730 [Woeseiaceae bacterium]
MTSKQFLIITVVIINFVCFPPVSVAAEAESPKAVLVTGTSTGIGRMIAETLATDGHFRTTGGDAEGGYSRTTGIESGVNRYLLQHRRGVG